MTIYRVPIELNWNGNGSPGVNVFHVRAGTGTTNTQDQALQAALDAIKTFYTSIASVLAYQVTVNSGEIVTMDTKEIATPTAFTVQSSGLNHAPPQLAMVVGWRTILAARRGMGRTFIGPLSEAMVDNSTGLPTNSAMTTLSNAAQALVTASLSTGSGWGLGVWGLEAAAPKGTNPRDLHSLPHISRDITSFRIHQRFATLRSRAK